jgi:uncharacterized protein (DUF1778 family)
MRPTANEKDARLNFRIRPDVKSRIERAASISGKSVTDFAVAALSDVADEVLQRHHDVELSDRDRDMFLAVIDRPSKPNRLLLRAAKTHKRLIVK